MQNFNYRHSMRLPGYDYSQPGPYFITFCTAERRCVLGEVKANGMQLDAAGEFVREVWLDLPRRFPRLELDEFVVMPNHVHGILRLPDGRAHADAVVQLGAVIRTLKAVTTHLIRQHGHPSFAWQSDYWDHVIRPDEDPDVFRLYIRDNPLNWHDDEDFVSS